MRSVVMERTDFLYEPPTGLLTPNILFLSLGTSFRSISSLFSYTMNPDSQFRRWARLNEKNTKDFLLSVHQDLVSSSHIYDPPFGKRKSTYVDWFASGKPLNSIEHIIQGSVLPFYTITHTRDTQHLGDSQDRSGPKTTGDHGPKSHPCKRA